jgi:hypothetical protein
MGKKPTKEDEDLIRIEVREHPDEDDLKEILGLESSD